MVPTKVYPKCPNCGREFRPGDHWFGANWCRAAFLLEAIAAHPGLSAWELSQGTGMIYQDTSRGLNKARDMELLRLTEEDREQGGKRYRYWPLANWQEKQRWLRSKEVAPLG